MAAFSPDGSRIAFRSERDGGGVFLMDADGGNLRRLTNEGFNPAWSPDGREIVYATSAANSPHSRNNARSRLMAVNVETRERRLIDIGSGKDAVQPSWSPKGGADRILGVARYRPRHLDRPGRRRRADAGDQ